MSKYEVREYMYRMQVGNFLYCYLRIAQSNINISYLQEMTISQ